MARAGLTRERIVAAALDLVDDVGLDGLSTRGLAVRLGVQSPALYWHFRDKTELVAAMADSMIFQLPDVANPAKLGSRVTKAALTTWLVERGQLFRRVLLSRRDGARIHAGTRPPAQRLAGVEAQLAALQRLGFDPVGAARVTLAISRFVVGWVLEEQSQTSAVGRLPDLAAYPVLTAALADLDGADPDAEFTRSLTAVVSGLVRTR